MEITIQQLQDYMYCPKLYKLCHIDKKSRSRDANIQMHFDNCMKQTGYYFFYRIQDGTVLSLKEFRRRFGELYIGNRTMAQTALLDRSHRNLARILEKRAINMLNNFYDKYSEDYGVPILINKEYQLKIGKTILKGQIPIIRENSNKQIEILHFYVDSNMYRKYALPIITKYDIPITASSLAFEKIYKTSQQHVCYGMYSGKEMKVNKDKKDYDSFCNTVKSVSTAIENELFYPILNNNCINCAYNKICART